MVINEMVKTVRERGIIRVENVVDGGLSELKFVWSSDPEDRMMEL